MQLTFPRSRDPGHPQKRPLNDRVRTLEDPNGHADYVEAWVTADDNYTWVCPECFIDFRERFH